MSTSHVQLTAKYRPQTFAQVVGQEEIRTVLSRTAATNRIAAAYLFSGTRGVGKTTLARIFAKALNCRTAPTPEPCNQCRLCRQITIGSAVDVAEIDGASNRGIEQARRLKEDVGYAPMEGRYKIIIIDEAHMLTREAFNALLKTLEEPPPGVTFIMATTEPHKFPATIVSRCQHYVFKRLTRSQLDAHLRRILESEGRPYEPAAVALLAKRAAGSVRDGMSLLEQVLTIGDQTLRLEDVRRVLGLAGSELLQRLVAAIRGRDCMEVSDILRELLDQGLDLGFFLRELTTLWRNLFLLRQAGRDALPLLDLPPDEAEAWLDVAAELSPTYIHAAWQLTLEGQRQVLVSMEPAQTLEMLLLNLAYLPQLLRLEDLPSPPGTHSTPAAPRPRKQTAPAPKPVSPAKPPLSEPAPAGSSGANPGSSSGPARESPQKPPGKPGVQTAREEHPAFPGPPNWKGFLEHYDRLSRSGKACLPGLRQVEGELRGDELVLRCLTRHICESLKSAQKRRALEPLLREYFGPGLRIRLEAPKESGQNEPGGIGAAAAEHPLIREFVDQFQAKVISHEPVPEGENQDPRPGKKTATNNPLNARSFR